jgi:hypothetical protein
MQTCQGSCHCSAVRFEIRTDFPELTTCDCSICRRKNALMVKVHESDFRLLAGEESLSMYQFHTHTAKHNFCSTCGNYPFHRREPTASLGSMMPRQLIRREFVQAPCLLIATAMTLRKVHENGAEYWPSPAKRAYYRGQIIRRSRAGDLPDCGRGRGP